MDPTLYPALARRLDESERSRHQIRQFSLEFPEMTIADGYAIQGEWVAMKLARGRKVKGHKIGLTSKAMQYASNIAEHEGQLDFDPGNDESVGRDRGAIPEEHVVEEHAVVGLGRRLTGPDCTLADVLAAADSVVPAVEIVDARIQQIDSETKGTRKVTDTISDNAANAGILLGGRPFKPTEGDLRWVSALCYRNGEIEVSGVAAAVLNHPANGVAWLANNPGALRRGARTRRSRVRRVVREPGRGAPGR